MSRWKLPKQPLTDTLSRTKATWELARLVARLSPLVKVSFCIVLCRCTHCFWWCQAKKDGQWPNLTAWSSYRRCSWVNFLWVLAKCFFFLKIRYNLNPNHFLNDTVISLLFPCNKLKLSCPLGSFSFIVLWAPTIIKTVERRFKYPPL